MKVVTASEMARVEKLAYAAGSSEKAFMEEAGRQVALVAAGMGQRQILVVVGKGNNGGDGRVAARYLQGAGFEVSVVPVEEMGVFPREGLVIDAIFGTGFTGQLEGKILQVVQAMNASGLPILAIDVPSGLNATTGEVGSDAVRATKTVALGFPKTGFFLRRGPEFLGELEVKSFGLPQRFADEASGEFTWIDDSIRTKMPKRSRVWHKYSRGYVVAFAGSPNMMGAAHLTTKAALRSGAGIVRLVCDQWSPALPEEVLAGRWEDTEKAGALLIGPGLGREDKTKLLLQKLFQIKKPMVIDADGLFWDLPFPAGSVLTPHRGEMERMLGGKLDEAQLLERTAAFAQEHGCVVVLKGPVTFIFGETVAVSTAGHPAMATAGCGDVLTGVIAALLAQGLTPFDAACLGVTIHGRAGTAAAQKLGYGEIAGDIVEQLPLVINSMER